MENIFIQLLDDAYLKLTRKTGFVVNNKHNVESLNIQKYKKDWNICFSDKARFIGYGI